MKNGDCSYSLPISSIELTRMSVLPDTHGYANAWWIRHSCLIFGKNLFHYVKLTLL